MSYFRLPQTTQERRANQDLLARPARGPHQLPHSWDDISVTARKSRNWKRFRKPNTDRSLITRPLANPLLTLSNPSTAGTARFPCQGPP